jgi:hypothetical protein
MSLSMSVCARREEVTVGFYDLRVERRKRPYGGKDEARVRNDLP